jgi:tetratricopeptide (TPR) repeat protein
MDDVSTDTLVLAALGSASDVSETDERGVALSELTATVSGGAQRLSRNVEIAATVEDLTDRGLVHRTSTEDEVRFWLTDEGRSRSETVLSRISNHDVEVVDGDERTLRPLAAAATERDLGVVELAAACSDDGVYYVQEEVSSDGIVGRETERERLRDIVEAVDGTGDGRVVTITGLPGIGKTTLAEAFLDDAPERVSVLRARCTATDTDPYRPIRDALANLEGDDPFTAAGVDPEDAQTYEAQQTALFHEITARLRPHSGVRVLFLDDVDEADAATWTYLAYLQDRLRTLPLVVLCTHRPGTLDQDNPFAPEHDESVEARHTRFELDGMDRAETKQLIEGQLQRRGAADAFVDAIHGRTDGTPLFVEATIEALVDSNQLDPQLQWYPDDVDAIDLPDAVRETVARQLDIAGDARDLLEWLAIADEFVPTTALQALSEQPADRIATVVDTLVDLDMLVRADDTRVRFQSNVVRETVLDELDAADRERRHAAFAQWLAGAIDDDSDAERIDRAATIAFHYERAGEATAAIEWYEKAAGRATDVYAHETATEHHHRVLDLARSADARGDLLRTGHRLADLHLTIGEYDEAERYVEFVRERVADDESRRQRRNARLAAAIAEERGEHDTAIMTASSALDRSETTDLERCRLLAVRADAEWSKGDYEAARETSRRLRDLAEELDATDLHTEAVQQLGVLAMEQSEYDRARESLEAALEEAREGADRHREADVRTALGIVAKRTGDLEEAREHWTAALEGYDDVGDRHQTAKVYNNLGLVAKARHEYDRALDQYGEALAELQRIGDEDTAALVRMNLGNVAEVRSEFDRARDQLEAAVEGFESVGRRHHAAVARLNLGNLLVTLGAYDRAAETLQDAFDATQSLGDTLREGQVQSERARLARKRDDVDAATARYADAIDAAEQVDNETLLAKTRADRAKHHYDNGDFEQAREDCEAALATFRANDDRVAAADAERTLGLLAVQAGDHDAARARLNAAEDGFRAVDDRHGIALVDQARAVRARARDDPERARESLESALETFDTVGATADALDALASLVELGTSNQWPTATRDWCDRGIERSTDRDHHTTPGREWFQDNRPD